MLKELVESVLGYNKDHSPGKALGVAMASLILADMGESGVEDEEFRSVINLGTLERRCGEFLKETGLVLRAVSKTSGTVLSSRETVGEITNAYARIDIVDWRKFVVYLQPEGDAEGVALFLGKLLMPQIHFAYAPTEEVFLEIVSGGDAIVEACERLGVAEATELGKVLSIMKAGYLREYLMVKRSGLLQKIGEGFGPSNWHTDANPGWYREKWDKALILLEQVSANPSAAPLASSLRAHLRESAAHAKGDLPNVSCYAAEQKEAFDRILDDVLVQV